MVVGHGADEVEQSLANGPSSSSSTRTATRHRPRAAADAAAPGRQDGTVVLLSGDVPLLTADSLQALARHAREAGAAATVITANVAAAVRLRPHRPHQRPDPKIVEERDASPAQKAITEINSGIYAFDLAPLFDALDAHRHREQAGRVLPARSRRDLPQAEARGRDLDRRARRRDSRHQQPHRTRRGQHHGPPAEKRRVDGRGRHA